jgi:hypothetical protein
MGLILLGGHPLVRPYHFVRASDTVEDPSPRAASNFDDRRPERKGAGLSRSNQASEKQWERLMPP